MGHYFRNPAMFNGQFKCYNCQKTLIAKIEGLFKLTLYCPRCKCTINVETQEAIPIAVDQMEKEKEMQNAGATSS